MLHVHSWLTSSLCLVVLTLSACGGQTSDASSADNCAPGSEKCACDSDGTCNSGLQCLGALCVATTGGSSGGASNAGNSTIAGAMSNAGNTTVGGAVPITGGAPTTGSALKLGGTGSTSGGTTGCNATIGNRSLDAGPNCGNGLVEVNIGEGCDDGNRIAGDGCSGNCQVEPNWLCPLACAPCLLTIICGDGLLQVGEICDDGINDGSYGGCAPDCQMGPYCGDGAVDGPEQCDNGSANASPGSAPYGSCLNSCKLGPYCGDGIMTDNEQCDEGMNNGSVASRCTPSCLSILLPD